VSDLHEPWCDSQLGPDFEVVPGEVRMTIFACMGCKGEVPPAPETAATGEGEFDGL
jgi:hypothetical protein